MRQPSKDEFRWEHWKESSEFWQERAKSYKAEKRGKFRRLVFIYGICFVVGIITGRLVF